MKDRGVVAAAEASPDRRQALLGELAREVHGHLAGKGNAWAAVLCEEGVSGDAELGCRGVLDRLERAARWAGQRVERGEYVPCELRARILALERGEGDHTDEGALE